MKKCSGYFMNMSGHYGLVRVCNCHWMMRVLPNRSYYERLKARR